MTSSGVDVYLEIKETPSSSKSRRACEACKKKKSKCSGTTPKCLKCEKNNRECVYIPYEKRVSILLSKYKELRDQLESQQAEIDKYKETINNLNINDGGNTVSKKRKLTIENHDELLNNPKNMKIADHNKIDLYFKEISLNYCLECISMTYFFLHDVLCPFGVQVLRKKIIKFFIYTSNNNVEITKENFMGNLGYWKPLALIIFAIGGRYNELNFVKTDDLILYSMEYLFPLTDIKSSNNPENYLIVSCFSLMSLYFRSISKDFDAVFYSNLSLQVGTHLRLHFQDDNGDLNVFDNMNNNDNNKIYETEIKSRVWWCSYAINRSIGAKMGDPLLVTSISEITRPFPTMINYDDNTGEVIKNTQEKYGHERFPTQEDFKKYLDLSTISQQICNEFNAKFKSSATGAATGFSTSTMAIDNDINNKSRTNSTSSLTINLENIIQRLINWTKDLPNNLKVDSCFRPLNLKNRKNRRLTCSIHLNYGYCIYLTTIPIFYTLLEKNRSTCNIINKTNNNSILNDNKKIISNLNIPKNVSELLTVSLNAVKLMVNLLVSCYNEKMLAMFGVLDLDYLYSAGLTFFMSKLLKLDYPECDELLNTCLYLINEMMKRGNHIATSKYETLKNLIDGVNMNFSTRKVLSRLDLSLANKEYIIIDEGQLNITKISPKFTPNGFAEYISTEVATSPSNVRFGTNDKFQVSLYSNKENNANIRVSGGYQNIDGDINRNTNTTGFDPSVNYSKSTNSNGDNDSSKNNIDSHNTAENNTNNNNTNVEYGVKDSDFGLDSNFNSGSNDNQYMGDYENEKEKSMINQERMSIPNILSPVPAFDMNDNFDSRLIDNNFLEYFQKLSESDFNSWENGWKTSQETDSYWDDFQRTLFGDKKFM
ncbi:hypothetical protein B5S33_g2665 [[Candida] boidinii]|nr:hypothetical protein B5S33_g2665 [[Candida] boidinii]